MIFGETIQLEVLGEEKTFGFKPELWLPPEGLECGTSIDGFGDCGYIFKPTSKSKPTKKEKKNALPLHVCEPTAEFVLDFFRGLRLVDGGFYNEPFEPIDWVLDAIYVVLATKMYDGSAREPGFYRPIQELFACVTRGGMKTAFMEALLCFLLAHAPAGSEGIFAQQSKEEAKAKMIPKTLEMIRLSPSMQHINPDTCWVGRTDKPGGADRFKRGDGFGEVNIRLAAPLNPGRSKGYRYSFGIFDEVGFMLDHQAESLIEETAKYSNVMPDPLWFIFSTLAAESAHYQRRRYAYALEVKKNPALNPRFWSYLYTAPPTAVPSVKLAMENGPLFKRGLLPQSILDGEFDSAKIDTSLLNKYARDRCGLAGDHALKFMPFEIWKRCAAEGGRKEIMEQMRGNRIYVGCDFSETSDLSAMCPVSWRSDGVQLICPYHWLPDAARPKLDALTRGLSEQWINDGWLEVLPAGDQFPARVAERCLEILEPYHDDIICWGYDPNHAEEAAIKWRDAGWQKDNHGVQIIQQGVGLSEPIKAAIRAAEFGLLLHTGDPVMDYCVSTAQKETDTKDPDKERLVKPERGVSTDRIDGAIAWLTGWKAAIAYRHYESKEKPKADWGSVGVDVITVN